MDRFHKLANHLFVSCFLFLAAVPLQGHCSNIFQRDMHCFLNGAVVEAKAGYFFFADSRMRQIYSNGGWDVQLAASIPICSRSERLSFNAYAAVEYLSCEGRSIGDHQKTSLWELPVNLGIQPVFSISPQVKLHCALGPRYFYLHQHNSSLFVDKAKSHNGVGLFANAGFNFMVRRNFFVDLFGEYSYAKAYVHSKKTNVSTRNIQVGGFTFGVGLGYAF